MRVSNDVMPATVHGHTDPKPITGKGKLAQKFNSPNHGLTVRSHGKFATGVMAAAARGKAAIDHMLFEFEDKPRFYSKTDVNRVIDWERFGE